VSEGRVHVALKHANGVTFPACLHMQDIVQGTTTGTPSKVTCCVCAAMLRRGA
jgi:hypothetical protein